MSGRTSEHDNLSRPATDRPRSRASADQYHDRASRILGGLSELLRTRPELRGVHAPADLADEAIRWTA